jgi:High potential iron-sulfur protein
MKVNRRIFAIQSIAATAAVVGADWAHAQASMLPESHPQASAMGYRADASKIDTAKFANFAPGQKCQECQMFRAQQSESSGQCAIFPGKLVSATGWCSAYIKKV